MRITTLALVLSVLIAILAMAPVSLLVATERRSESIGLIRRALSLEPAARVGDVEEGELDSSRGRRLGRRVRLGDSEVVELADRRVSGRAHRV